MSSIFLTYTALIQPHQQKRNAPPWTGAAGKSAPMDGGYLPHGTNTPAVGPRIQDNALMGTGH